MRPENKKKQTQPKKKAQTTQRRAKLTPLQKLVKASDELLDKCARLAKANREKAEHICEQREQIEALQKENAWQNQKRVECQNETQKIIESNAQTIASIEKQATAKIEALKKWLFWLIVSNIICIIILLYLLNY